MCLLNGQQFEVGESYFIDACTRATCRQSGLFLEENLAHQCPLITGCSLLVQPAGQCCLVCQGE